MTTAAVHTERAAWRDAARYLVLQVEFPDELSIGGCNLNPTVIVKQFGAKNGMVVFERNPGLVGRVGDLLVKHGYGFSVVSIGRVEKNDLGSLRAMLDDWGFTGDPQTKPDWVAEWRDTS